MGWETQGSGQVHSNPLTWERELCHFSVRVTLAPLSEHGFYFYFFLIEKVKRVASALLCPANDCEDEVNEHCANAPHFCKFYASKAWPLLLRFFTSLRDSNSRGRNCSFFSECLIIWELPRLDFVLPMGGHVPSGWWLPSGWKTCVYVWIRLRAPLSSRLRIGSLASQRAMCLIDHTMEEIGLKANPTHYFTSSTQRTLVCLLVLFHVLFGTLFSILPYRAGDFRPPAFQNSPMPVPASVSEVLYNRTFYENGNILYMLCPIW